MSKKMAVIADEETVFLFRLVGVVDVFSTDSGVEARDILTKLAKTGNYVLVVLTQNLANEIGRELEVIAAGFKDLAVVVLPSRTTPAVSKFDILREIVRRAIGFEVSIDER